MKLIAVVRVIGAIIAAMATAFVLLTAVELYSAVVHPFPEGFDGSMEATCQHVARYPDWVLGTVVPMWGGIAFLCTWLAGRIGNWLSAVLIGVVLVIALVSNVLMLPYPAWFKGVMPVVIAITVVSAAMRRPSTPPAMPDPQAI